MKKLFAAILLLLAGLSVLGFAACEKQSAHTHDWNEWVLVKDATCTEEGLKTRTCKGCEETEESKIEKLAHTPYVSVEALEPDCETPGRSEGTVCAVCHTVLTASKSLAAIDHRYQTPSSNGDGTHTMVCERDHDHKKTDPCTFELTSKTETALQYTCRECGFVRTEERAGHEHLYDAPVHEERAGEHVHVRRCLIGDHDEVTSCSFQDELVPSTCEEGGYTRHTCSVCGYFYTDSPIDPISHSFGAFQSDGTGYHYRTCLLCGSYTERAACSEFNEEILSKGSCKTLGEVKKICKDCGYSLVVPSQPGHSFDEGWKAIEGQEHRHKRVCSLCGFSEEGDCAFESTEVAPTCDKDGYTEHVCTLCGDRHSHVKENTKLSHDYSIPQIDEENPTKHYLLCSHDNSHKISAACSLSSVTSDASCGKDASITYTCSVCKKSRVETKSGTALSHSFSSAEYIGEENGVPMHKRVCQRQNCGYEEISACEMVSPEEADVCLPKTILFFAKASGEVCKDCKQMDGSSSLRHDWSAWEIEGKAGENSTHKRTCQKCGKSETEQCDFESITSDPTCEENGKIVYTCAGCNASYTKENGKALAHVWSGATSIAGNQHTKTCLTCGKTETEACEFTVTNIDATCEESGKKVHLCSACGYSYEETTGNALGHDYEDWKSSGDGTHSRICKRDRAHVEIVSCDYEEKETPSTCTELGKTVYTCKVCRYSHEETERDLLPHSFGAWSNPTENSHSRTCTVCGTKEEGACSEIVSEHVPSTCAKEGKTVYSCSACQKQLRSEVLTTEHSFGPYLQREGYEHGYHYRICSVCKAEESGECEYSEDIKKPTCTQNGVITHTCAICQKVHTHEGDTATGHRYSNPVFDSVSHKHRETCENGCGEVRETECSMEETKFEASTCSETGLKVYTCKVCKGSYELKVEKLPHSFEETYHEKEGEEHYKTCSICKYQEVSSCSFVYSSKDPTCLENGYKKKTCSLCNREITTETLSALGHSFPESWVHDSQKTNGKDTHSRKCVRCEVTETKDCVFGPVSNAHACMPPDGVDQICSGCSYVEDREDLQLTHTWGSYIQTEINGVKGHKRVCDTCGATEEAVCEFTITTESPTCDTPEKEIKTCSLCGFSETTIHKDKLGHKWEVTSSNESGHTHKCTVCFKVETVSHDFEESNLCAECKFDGLTYQLAKGGNSYHVSGDNRVPRAEKIVVSAFYGKDHLPVTAIGITAFYENRYLEEITLPSSIINIEYCAFKGCSNLKTVTFDEVEKSELLSIDGYAFSDCSSLQSFTLPEKTEKLAGNAFQNTRALTSLEVKGEKTISIGLSCFEGSKLLQIEKGALYLGKQLLFVKPETDGEFKIEEGTLSIAGGAFRNCKISSLKIPSSLTLIEADAFEGCVGLQSVEYSGGINEWFSIRFISDLSSPMHYAENLHIEKVEGDIVIPDKVEAIPAGTFRNTDIKSVKIPEGVKSIGANAFRGCKSLEKIEIASSVQIIGKDAFKDSLYYNTEKNWKDGKVLYISNHLIEAKENLDSTYKLEEGTLTIAAFAFANTKISDITLSSSLVYIGQEAFGTVENGTLQKARFEGGNESYQGHDWFGWGVIGRQFRIREMNEASLAHSLKFYNQSWRRL